MSRLVEPVVCRGRRWGRPANNTTRSQHPLNSGQWLGIGPQFRGPGVVGPDSTRPRFDPENISMHNIHGIIDFVPLYTLKRFILFLLKQ